MNSRGKGSVQITPEGRWRARLPSRLGKRDVGTFDTEQEALGTLRAVLEQTSGQSLRTLRAWGELWLKRRAARGLSSYKDDVGRWEQHILQSRLADREVRGIQPRDVASFARWLSTRPCAVQVRGGGWERPEGGRPISRQTQQHALKLLQLALDDAAIEGWCSASPATKIRPVQDQAGAEERRHLGRAQIEQLLSCAVIPLEVRQGYAVALYTGLRPAELWALRWEDVHLDGRPRVLVRAAVKRSGGEGAPKSGKARTVPLLQPAQDALRALQERSRSELVFPGDDGTPRQTGDDLGWATKLRGGQAPQVGWRERAGLPGDLVFYSLRHTCATALLHGWWGRKWAIDEVRAMLGHSSVIVTQKYLHEDEEALLDAAAETRTATGPGSGPGPTAEAGPLTDGAPGRSRTCDPRLRRLDGHDGDSGSRSIPGPVELLCEVAAQREVSTALIRQVAAAALLELKDAGALAARALGEGPHALGAAIELAGRLLEQRAANARRAG